MASCIYTDPQANWFDRRWDILQKILCATNTIAAGGGGGGGGSGANLLGVVNPGGVVNAVAIGQLYTNTATGSVWQATATGTGSWIEIV